MVIVGDDDDGDVVCFDYDAADQFQLIRLLLLLLLFLLVKLLMMAMVIVKILF